MASRVQGVKSLSLLLSNGIIEAHLCIVYCFELDSLSNGCFELDSVSKGIRHCVCALSEADSWHAGPQPHMGTIPIATAGWG